MRELVLVGGGYGHVQVLKALARQPIPGARVTLVSRDAATAYTAMLPGFLAGRYGAAECAIDLEPLAAAAGVRLLRGEVMGVNPTDRTVGLRGGTVLPYEVLSINIGAAPQLDAVPGAAEHAIALKPLDRLAARWAALAEAIGAGSGLVHMLVVGGGAGGVEIALAVRQGLGRILAAAGRNPRDLDVTILSRSGLLPHYPPSLRRRMARILERRGIALRRTSVRAVLPDAVRDQDGRLHPCTGLFWTTQADAVDWPGVAGLAVDARGFIAVDGTLRSISHPRIFAVGDIANLTGQDCPKAGSVALRQGLTLAANLHAALTGAPLGTFQSPAAVLSLIGTGDGCAVAQRGAWSIEGRWAWRLKDYIDRRFVRSCRVAA